MIIDFTSCVRNDFKAYGGANGSKINIAYDGKNYMLKFPPKPTLNREISYSNSCVSEYIACHIFETLGFTVQQTLLGTYTYGQKKEYVVVACEDFTSPEKRLIEFAALKNTCIDSPQDGYGTELTGILEAIREQNILQPEKLQDFFWEMFIADAFLGNFDRHNGNWGILVDEAHAMAEIAPIYDCGSCLYPQVSPQDIPIILEDDSEIDKRIFVYPTSAIKADNTKINYFEFISSHANPDCSRALIKIASKIDMEKIYKVIDETPFISETQKTFYKRMVLERKNRIIDHSLEKTPHSVHKG